MDIEKLVERQRAFFRENKTKELKFRLQALKRLEDAIVNNEEDLKAALKEDLNKSSMESYMTEIGLTLSEIRYVRKNLSRWDQDEKVVTPLAQFHAKSFVRREPYGVVLVMAPWNYPVMLSLEPLIGAIAAGNCCILKPSAYAPAVSAALNRLIQQVFPSRFVSVVEGGREENTMLLEQKFDYIFFTGGVQVGKLVMKKAAENLTPVTLELGGKSPCIVDKTANLNLAARRIAFGKFLNSGQTCVAPDYLLVQEEVKDRLIELLKKWIHRMLGENPLESPDYPRMISRKHFDRVRRLMDGQQIAEGGYGDQETLQIAPTILDRVPWDAPVMQEEIFGPVLPVLTFSDIDEVIGKLKEKEKPLALYLFTTSRENEERVLRELSFGGGCINDTVIHLATSRMGFGGVGSSGMGSYHGKNSYETFSHAKSIVKKSNWIDLPIRYYPYSKTKEKLLRSFL